MSVWRELGHNLFALATQSQRRRAAGAFTAQQNWPAAILFYHRVADTVPTPWTITERGFTEHLDLFLKTGQLASLAEIQAEQSAGLRDRLKIAVTFDDGYRDNLKFAIPELVRRRIPCTYFVTTENIETGTPFRHDLVRRQPLPVNTKSEIREMAEAGIEIGGHTATHLDLGHNWLHEKLVAELADSRKKLQDWTGQPIRYFAFPFGQRHNISQAAIDMVAEAGYAGFVSAYGAWNHPGRDDFHLRRFHGDPCTAAVRDWLTLDPRKLFEKKTLVYQRPEQFDATEVLDPSKLPTPKALDPVAVPNQAIPTESKNPFGVQASSTYHTSPG